MTSSTPTPMPYRRVSLITATRGGVGVVGVGAGDAACDRTNGCVGGVGGGVDRGRRCGCVSGCDGCNVAQRCFQAFPHSHAAPTTSTGICNGNRIGATDGRALPTWRLCANGSHRRPDHKQQHEACPNLPTHGNRHGSSKPRAPAPPPPHPRPLMRAPHRNGQRQRSIGRHVRDDTVKSTNQHHWPFTRAPRDRSQPLGNTTCAFATGAQRKSCALLPPRQPPPHPTQALLPPTIALVAVAVLGCMGWVAR